MKFEAEIRELLIQNTIRLIAEGGFEKATTKEITHCGGSLPGIKMNESYIYRLFGCKENLYLAAFEKIDRELASAFYKGVELSKNDDSPIAEQMYDFFLRAWEYLLNNENHCRCYVRFYYSVYFTDKALVPHKKLFKEMLTVLAPIFKKEANVFAVMHSVFVSLLDFSIRVLNGDLEDNDGNRAHVFNILYCMMITYFKDEESNVAPFEQLKISLASN